MSEELVEMLFWGIVILQLAAIIFMVVSVRRDVKAMRQALLEVATVLRDRSPSPNRSPGRGPGVAGPRKPLRNVLSP
jgi:hypothetical protein